MKLKTPLCDLLGIEVPIIQAGMGWDKEGMTTPPELVAAVSNAGGLGCIGGSSIRPEVIREKRDPGEIPEACRVHERIDSETRFSAATAGQEELGQNTQGNPRTAAGDSRRESADSDYRVGRYRRSGAARARQRNQGDGAGGRSEARAQPRAQRRRCDYFAGL